MLSNIDIFDFKFVDRAKEKKKVDSFFYSDITTLWIDGAHGIGKSFFIEKYIIPKAQESFSHVLYINKSLNENKKNYLEILLEEMEKQLPVPFSKYLNEHYNFWYNTTKNITKNISDNNYWGKMPKIITSLLDVGGVFLSKYDTEHSSSKVLKEYFEDAILNSNLFLILDNFSYCDEDSFSILEDVFIRLKDIPNLRLVLCTTSEERKKMPNLDTLLCEKISNIYILMEKIEDVSYFREIISNKFHMASFLNSKIDDIYEICKGVPDNLKEFVRQLYIQNGIEITNEEFVIVQDKVLELINQKIIKFNPEKLQPSEKIIVQIVTLFGMPIPYMILEDFIIYISEKSEYDSLIFKFVKNKIEEIIIRLLEAKILVIHTDKNVEYLSFEHDNLFDALSNYYHQENQAAHIGYIHLLLFEYIKNNEAKIRQCGFTDIDIKILKADQSYNASDLNWQEYNEELAFYFYNNNQIYRCNQIMSRIRKRCTNISNKLLFLMAKVFYEIAEYNSCLEILNTINIENINNKEKYDYYLLLGKTVSFNNSKTAFDYFQKALKLPNQIEQECQLKYYSEMSLSEISNGLEKAQSIFYEFEDKLEYKESKVYVSVLRSSVNLFSPERSITYLEEGLKIAENANDTLEEGKLANNLGFIHTRMEEYQEAEKFFQQSCVKLENVKAFEMSYPLTNLAFIQMVKQNWEEALKYIDLAHIYNKTTFIPYVLKSHSMICLVNMGRLEEANDIKNELLDDIKAKKFVDYKMIKKSKLNCAYVATIMGDITLKEQLLHECSALVRGTNAQNRYLSLCKKMEFVPPNDLYVQSEEVYDLYDIIDFEPWVVTFGHD